MKPANPDFEAVCRESFARQGMMRSMGVEMALVEPGRCELHLPFGPHLTQQNGFFHGGAVAALADVAGGYAAMSLVPPGVDVLTAEFKINLLAPAVGDTLVASGRVVKGGRTLSVVHVDVYGVTDGHRRICATMLATMFVGAR